MKRLRKTYINYDATVYATSGGCRCEKGFGLPYQIPHAQKTTPNSNPIDKTVRETKLLLKLAEDKFNQIGAVYWTMVEGNRYDCRYNNHQRPLVYPVQPVQVGSTRIFSPYDQPSEFEFYQPLETCSQDCYNNATVRLMEKRINDLEKLVISVGRQSEERQSEERQLEERLSDESVVETCHKPCENFDAQCSHEQKQETRPKQKKQDRSKRRKNGEKPQIRIKVSNKQRKVDKKQGGAGDVTTRKSRPIKTLYAADEESAGSEGSENEALPSRKSEHCDPPPVPTFEMKRQAKLTENIIEQLDKQRDEIQELKYLMKECLYQIKHQKQKHPDYGIPRRKQPWNHIDDDHDDMDEMMGAKNKRRQSVNIENQPATDLSATELESTDGSKSVNVRKQKQKKTKEKIESTQTKTRKFELLRCICRWCTCSLCCRD